MNTDMIGWGFAGLHRGAGEEWRREFCECEPETGNAPCEYCAIHKALTYARQLECQVTERDTDIVTLKTEMAYTILQRDALLEMTWLDLPGEFDESISQWKKEFEKGWERR